MTSHGIEPKFLSERIGKEFLQVCGNLVLFDEDDQTSRLAHHTVGQFRSENKIPRVDSGHSGRRYLSDLPTVSDFERQIVTVAKGCEIFKAGDVSQSAFARTLQIMGISKGAYDFFLAIYSQKTICHCQTRIILSSLENTKGNRQRLRWSSSIVS